MGREVRIVMIVFALLLTAGPALVASGQDESEEALTLRLTRSLGYSLGSQMQGRFTIRAEGPPELSRVEFLLDGQVIGRDDEAPFRLGFNTREYPVGTHTLAVIGILTNGEQLESETVSRQFVATSSTTIAVIAIVALVLVFRAASYFLARRAGSMSAAYGYLGATVCPKCGRPFGIHWWSLRLVVGRLDRCPHCGKWNMVGRASAAELEAADALDQNDDERPGQGDAVGQEEELRRRIEESRYDQGR